MPLAFSVFVGTIAVGLASMLVYGARGRKRDADIEGKAGQFALGGFVLHWFMWVISPLVGMSRRLGLTPDFYNYAGLLLGLASGPLIATGRLELAGWCIVFSGIADILDGRIARLTGKASDYGDFIDSTFDRFAEAATFLGFGYYLRATPSGALLAGAALGGSLLVSYARARGEVLGVTCTGGLMQRAERLALSAVVCLTDPFVTRRFGLVPGTLVLWMLWLMTITTVPTAVYRTVWIARRLRAK